MSFSEKLVQLRKREKMSQEQLAALLDVTRQSVSKWESGQTYPEMDKLLAMCKIFKCSLDDLTNDEVTTVNIGDKKKGNLNDFVDSVLEFIEKVYHMFLKMSAGEIIRCFFVMGCIFIGLFIFRPPFDFLESSVGSLFHNFGDGAIVSTCTGLFNLMVDICFFILYILVFVYLFKLIYLDSYEEIEVVKETPKEKGVEAKETKQPIVVERRKDKSYVFFDILGKGAILFIKGMVCCFSFPFVISLFLMSAGLLVAIAFLFHGVFYLGILLGFLFAIILNVLFLEIVLNFLMNRKTSGRRLLLTFFTGIIGLGLSFGIFMVECANTQFINDVPANEKTTTTEKRVSMTEEFMVPHHMDVTYKVDESLNNEVILQVEYYDEFSKLIFPEENATYFYREDVSENGVLMRLMNQLMSDLSHKKIYNYSKLFETKTTITATSANIEKMKENARKALEEQNRIDEENEMQEYEDEFERLQDENEQLIEEKEKLQEKVDNQQVEIEDYKAKIQEYKENLKSLLTD